MQKIPITTEGYKNLQKEITQLKTIDRPNIIEAIATAREFGDLSENAEYHAAKEKQSFIEGRISQLENIFSNADVIDTTKLTTDKITFGTKVTLLDDNTDKQYTYRIVGEYEADINHNKISIKSPIARALIGKRINDIADVITPKGEKNYEILAIEI